jgi:hypothetical protein
VSKTQRQWFARSDRDLSSLAALAGWESEGGTLSADQGSPPPSAPRLARRIRDAIFAGWRRRSWHIKRALALALVAGVWVLRNRVARRAWERRQSTIARRASALRSKWARAS